MIDSLAGGDKTKYEKVLQFEMGTAFTMLLMDAEKAALNMRIQRARQKQ